MTETPKDGSAGKEIVSRNSSKKNKDKGMNNNRTRREGEMSRKIDNEIKRLKKWQEECKLVMMFFGAVSAVWVFFTRLFNGEAPEAMKKVMATEAREIGGAGNVAKVAVASTPPATDWILIVSVVLFIVFVGLGIHYFIKIIKKHSRFNGHGMYR